MIFDYSITKQISVKCSNLSCSHVYKIQNRREPVINDPGFVVMKCPKCHCDTRVRVWNIDYFKKNKGVVGVYECGEDKKYTDLSSVALGVSLEEETIVEETSQMDLNPKISFWELMGQKKPNKVLNEELNSKRPNLGPGRIWLR